MRAFFDRIHFIFARQVGAWQLCCGRGDEHRCVHCGDCGRIAEPKDIMKKCVVAGILMRALAAHNHPELDFGEQKKIYGDAIREDPALGRDRLYLIPSGKTLQVDVADVCDYCTAKRQCPNRTKPGQLRRFNPDFGCAKLDAFMRTIADCR